LAPREKYRHHPVFLHFERWAGIVPAGFDVDFLGSKMPLRFFDSERRQLADHYEAPLYAPFDEEYFEWIDLLEAVAFAEGSFIMLEVGAGFGRWTVRAATAAAQRRLPCSLIAVEAEPTRASWIHENLKINSVPAGQCTVIHAAVTARDGTTGFDIPADPARCYGEAIGGSTMVPAVSLSRLLQPLALVDLIDMDIQGAEVEALSPAMDSLAQKVKRVHVETHSATIDEEILRLFRRAGWKPHFLFRYNTADITPWGRINFQGGVQSWLNPRLAKAQELRQARTIQNSRGARLVAEGRALLDRIAPAGTLRRKAAGAVLRPLSTKYQRDAEDRARRPA
jgi:FkbM family methyltransferase